MWQLGAKDIQLRRREFDQFGFTLIELIVVIVLMGIISVAGTEIIRNSADAYSKMTGRQAIGSAARVTVERVTRELRSALPNSVRVNASNTCFEFLPVNAAGTYITLPVSASATTFVSARMNPGLDAVSGRVAVYSLSNQVYDTAEGMLSPAATLGAPNANNEIVVTMASAYQFGNNSIQSRYYLVADPVSFCIDGDNLFRYQNYGLVTVQPDIADLPTSLPARALLANGLAASVSPFDVSGSTLTRNSIVRMDLIFSVSGESARIEHEVQVRNVP